MKFLSSQWRKLREKGYREEFVAGQAKRAIPFQIRALMRKRELSQEDLAKKSRLTQGVISRAANPAYGNLSLNTILKVAAGLDVAFIGLFVPFSKLVDFYDNLSEDVLADVKTFEEEDVQAQEVDVDQTASLEGLRIAIAEMAAEDQEKVLRAKPIQQELNFDKQAGVVFPIKPLKQKGELDERNSSHTDGEQRNEYAAAAA